MTEQTYSDAGHEAKYFAQIPRMADDDLNLYEYRLYGHIKQVCGAANNRLCNEGERAMAAHCGMSRTKLREARQGLIDKGFVIVMQEGAPRTKGNSGKTWVLVTADIWPQNVARYSADNGTQVDRYKHNGTDMDRHNTDNGTQVDHLTVLNGTDMDHIKNSTNNNIKELSPPEQKPPTVLEADRAVYGGGDGQKGSDSKLVAGMIAAWLAAQDAVQPAAYGNKAIREQAQLLLGQGMTPDDVRDFVQARKREPFWKDKFIKFDKVATELIAWRKAHPRKSVLDDSGAVRKGDCLMYEIPEDARHSVEGIKFEGDAA